MGTATSPRAALLDALARTCQAPGCDESLQGRRAGTRTCSTRCRVALHRAERAAPPEPWHWLTYRPAPDDPPFMSSDELDAAGLAAWLEERPGFDPGSLNGQRRSFERWRSGQVARADVYTADEVLTAVDLRLSAVPEELWR